MKGRAQGDSRPVLATWTPKEQSGAKGEGVGHEDCAVDCSGWLGWDTGLRMTKGGGGLLGLVLLGGGRDAERVAGGEGEGHRVGELEQQHRPRGDRQLGLHHTDEEGEEEVGEEGGEDEGEDGRGEVLAAPQAPQPDHRGEADGAQEADVCFDGGVDDGPVELHPFRTQPHRRQPEQYRLSRPPPEPYAEDFDDPVGPAAPFQHVM
mmetsp:Transcript_25869/g.44544  ORF Transcript_25869/g.44544 Transcript_25869/m.44544 type:complete len:206 (+) Transcript_25869:210-827(+)